MCKPCLTASNTGRVCTVKSFNSTKIWHVRFLVFGEHILLNSSHTFTSLEQENTNLTQKMNPVFLPSRLLPALKEFTWHDLFFDLETLSWTIRISSTSKEFSPGKYIFSIKISCEIWKQIFPNINPLRKHLDLHFIYRAIYILKINISI